MAYCVISQKSADLFAYLSTIEIGKSSQNIMNYLSALCESGLVPCPVYTIYMSAGHCIIPSHAYGTLNKQLPFLCVSEICD